MIAQASKDERGKYAGGAAGDQTGREVWMTNWYSYPWDTVIRAKDSTMADKIAYCMKAACENDKIGYDQSQRNSLLIAAEQYGYDCGKVKKAVETDCSALVTVACIYAGVSKDVLYKGGNSSVTWNLAERLYDTGLFEVLKGTEYTKSKDNLKNGDILLNTKNHVAVWVSEEPAKESAKETTVTKNDYAERLDYNLAGTYEVIAGAGLNLRSGAGTGKAIHCTMQKGTKVKCYGYYTERGGYKWLYVVLPSGVSGFAVQTYLRRC